MADYIAVCIEPAIAVIIFVIIFATIFFLIAWNSTTGAGVESDRQKNEHQ